MDFNNLQPGDLVFFSIAGNDVVNHEGIFIGNDQFINSSSSKGVTIYTSVPIGNLFILEQNEYFNRLGDIFKGSDLQSLV